MAAQYQLVMHSGPTPGKVFPLDGDILIIGRESENNIVINDAEVSRKHTQLVFQGGKFVVTDLGSTNGTFVNGQRLTGQHVLIPGEVVSLGEQINLLFEAVGNVDPNATVMSGSHAPTAVPHRAPPAPPRPAYQPAPAPAYQQAPAPMYAGQIPSGPAPVQQSAPAKGNNSRMIMIVVGVLALCLICSCIGMLWYIDSNNLWCSYMPFLFPAACRG